MGVLYMKIFIQVIVLYFIFVSHVFADEKIELVLEMLEVTNAKDAHDQIIEGYIKNISQGMDDERKVKIRDYFYEAMGWEKIIGPMIDIYVESYTVEELKAINKFFSSEIGKSFIAKSPEVNRKSVEMMSANIKKAMSKLQ